ncbi:D-alanyl-D-alanine carboxypeptidase family protein [Bacillus tianshenii]|nr:D-alanyl-D-alanine carboxypeptidase family protein [Bacillus tianshenii]
MKLLYICFLLVFAGVSIYPMEAQAAVSTSAQSSILMEQESGRVLYEKDIDTPRRIASITKIMTAVLAVESGKLDDIVKVSKRAEGTEGSSLYLRAGDEIKLEDLVFGLMLRSGNDAAVAIAEHVGGSLEGFVHMMNEKAAEIGMTNTVFANPHGLDDAENHYSTAYDMALLTRYAMQNEDYKKIAGTKSHRSDGFGVWRNKNKLLTSLYEPCTGGKTGFTKRAGRTLVTTASKDGENLIAVTLRASNDWQDHETMYEWGFKTFDKKVVLKEGKLSNIDDDFYKGHATVKREVTYPLTKKEEESIHHEIQLIEPQENWKQIGVPNVVGKVDILADERLIEEVPIFYNGNPPWEKPSWWEKLKNVLLQFVGVE